MRKNICLLLVFLSLFIFNLSAQEVFNGCPMIGDAKGKADQETNKKKNRYTFPNASQVDPSITLEAMLQPGDDEDRFSEASAAQITGYVVHVSERGSSETCNCHNTQVMFTDTHIDIVLDPGDDSKKRRVVVEVTPRLRAIMADRGVDWSHQALQELEGKFVTFTGWMLWDWRHKKDAENTDPGDRQNWRATCWEIHPVTAIEVQDENPILASAEFENEDENPVVPDGANGFTSGSGFGNSFAFNAPNNSNTTYPFNPRLNIQTKNAADLLPLILLGAILGMCGQVVRLLVGIRKSKNEKGGNATLTDLVESKQLLIGLLISLIIGGIAGVLSSLNVDGTNLSDETILTILIAGYAGTDFIEGFIVNTSKGSSGPSPKPRTASGANP